MVTSAEKERQKLVKLSSSFSALRESFAFKAKRNFHVTYSVLGHGNNEIENVDSLKKYASHT